MSDDLNRASRMVALFQLMKKMDEVRLSQAARLRDAARDDATSLMSDLSEARLNDVLYTSQLVRKLAAVDAEVKKRSEECVAVETSMARSDVKLQRAKVVFEEYEQAHHQALSKIGLLEIVEAASVARTKR